MHWLAAAAAVCMSIRLLVMQAPHASEAVFRALGLRAANIDIILTSAVGYTKSPRPHAMHQIQLGLEVPCCPAFWLRQQDLC